MERLTVWNGSKYILPQGRTSDGESNWRRIADRLAELENAVELGDLTITETRYGFSDIMLPIDSKRIHSFVRIWNDSCERIVKYWLTDPEWAVGFETMKAEHWMFKDLGRQASAMYFMDLFDDAGYASDRFIYDFCKAEVERRKGVIK